MAMAVVATGPILLLYPYIQKYFVKASPSARSKVNPAPSIRIHPAGCRIQHHNPKETGGITMKKSFRIAAILAAMAVSVSMVMAGCDSGSSSSSSGGSTGGDSGSTASTTEPGEPGRQGDNWVNANGDQIDISDHVDLVVYTFAGSSPNDVDMINEAANKINEQAINASVDVQVMNDWRSRYNLALSSGESIDLIWTAMWFQYQPYAYDGAWMDITDMVDEVVPELRDLIGEDMWEQCRIDGRDYAIPSTNLSEHPVGRRLAGRPPEGDGLLRNHQRRDDGGIRGSDLEHHPEMIPFCEATPAACSTRCPNSPTPLSAWATRSFPTALALTPRPTRCISGIPPTGLRTTASGSATGLSKAMYSPTSALPPTIITTASSPASMRAPTASAPAICPT